MIRRSSWDQPQTTLDCPWPPFTAISWVVCGQGDSKGQGWKNNGSNVPWSAGLDCLMFFVLNKPLENCGHAFRNLHYNTVLSDVTKVASVVCP